jgi:hypothetical protein
MDIVLDNKMERNVRCSILMPCVITVSSTLEDPGD